MDEQHREARPARRAVGTPVLVQELPAWPLTATAVVLAAAVAILLLLSVPAGL